MKTTLFGANLIAALGTATSVLAAGGVREDNSGPFIWGFLAFCALIVVVQLMPAIILLANFIIALVKKPQPQQDGKTGQ